jgi:hypothetical protein
MAESTSEAAVIAALETIGTERGSYGLTLNATLSPDAIETIGTALAARLSGYRPQAIVVWRTFGDAVLAHIVARELGAVVLHAVEQEGAAALEQAAAGLRVALLATAWDKPSRIAEGRAVVTVAGATVETIAAVFGTAALQEVDDVPTAFLVSELPASTAGGPR